jgi:MFS family permease
VNSWVVDAGSRSPFLPFRGGHFALVLGGCLLLVPAGHASDRFGPRKVLLLTNIAAGGLFLSLLRVNASPWTFIPLVALFGAFNGANNVVVVAEGNRLLRGQGSGASALLMGLPWCLAASASVIAGILADPARGGSPSSALTWIALGIPVTIGASALLRESDRRID